jgi:transposase-like protein
MARRNAWQWAKLVKEWKRSGKTASEFGVRAGVDASALHSWRWRLRKDGLLEDERETDTSMLPAFLPVRVVSRADEPERIATGDQHVDIVVDERNTVRVLPGFDDSTLRRVLDVLHEKAAR